MSNLIIEAVNSIYDECLEHAYSQWVNGLFGWHPDFSIEEQKEAFLVLLKRLLDEDEVVPFPPYQNRDNLPYEAQCRAAYDRDDIWDVTNDYVIEYIRVNWPDNLDTSHDERLTAFWYTYCPGIGWIDKENGVIIAS